VKEQVQQRSACTIHKSNNETIINTNICEKTQDPQCKFAVGSLKVAIEKPGILPDIENNKPSIAYANSCFLPNNYPTFGNVTQIHETTRTKREVTFAVVALISVLVGALVASIIQFQMKTYNHMVDDLVFPTFGVFKVVYHEHPFAFSPSAISVMP